MVFGITGNVERENVFDAVKNTLQYLQSQEIQYYIDNRFESICDSRDALIPVEELGEKTHIVLVFGGDGTLLHVSKMLAPFEIPVLGINMGQLGFLTEISPSELPEKIKEVLNKNYVVDSRKMLEGNIVGNENDVCFAANDIVVDKGEYPRLMKVNLTIDESFSYTYAANGLIISTATGSTAYSLSAGGPILHPQVDNLLITPICAHTLSLRPMIVPDSFVLEVKLITGPEEAIVQADGKPHLTLRLGEKLKIERNHNKIHLIHFEGHDFFKVLDNKLGWGRRHENNVNDS